MQVYRIRIILAAVVLFTVAGCKSTVEPAKVTCPPAPPPNATLNLNIDDGSGHDKGGYEAHTTGLAQNSVVTWTFGAAFSVNFKKDNSPCIGGSPIASTTVAPFTASCTIMNPPSGTKFPYTISLGSGAAPDISKPARKKFGPTGTSDHCEGCIIDN